MKNKLAVVALSGLFSEMSGPGPALVSLANAVVSTLGADKLLLKPYSVLGGPFGALGNLDEFLLLQAESDQTIYIGHSFGFAAVKWLMDRFAERGITNVLFCIGLDGVPNADRFGEFFPAQEADFDTTRRWHIAVSQRAMQLYQRRQLFPQGTQISANNASRWNRSVSLGEVPGCDRTNDHMSIVNDPAVVDYVVSQCLQLTSRNN